ncbi:MAG: AlpA family transcriptional regulator [Denitrovibrio sp.]|nr:MAG: AlpA family transcriptional regulator [Denitrovibrio sp.]
MKKIRILRRKEVESVTGLCRSSIYAKVEKGIFPKPIKLGTRSVGWIESEINEWLENRIAATRGVVSNETY